MLKFVEYMVTFEELPTEVTLSFSISNCQNHCPGCHSPYLHADTGEELTDQKLDELIQKNSGITAVLFLGEGNDQFRLISLACRVKALHGLNAALYSGRDDVEDKLWEVFDYIKIGSYKQELGPLNKVTTNQRLYHYHPMFSDVSRGRKGWRDITNMFWKIKE